MSEDNNILIVIVLGISFWFIASGLASIKNEINILNNTIEKSNSIEFDKMALQCKNNKEKICMFYTNLGNTKVQISDEADKLIKENK